MIVVLGRAWRADVNICWRCNEAFVGNGCHGWDNIRYHARLNYQLVYICKACWGTCPYRGAISLAKRQGGELTTSEAVGKLTKVDK